MVDRKYVVYYELTTEYEAVVKASTKEKAINKVKDVIGDDANIILSYELEN